jgi:hypothetical protein
MLQRRAPVRYRHELVGMGTDAMENGVIYPFKSTESP